MRLIHKKSLADQVLDELKRMIRSKDLRAGDKLPNQVELAAQLGVSRTSLREAISKLAFLGAVDRKPGFGTVLKSTYLVLNADTIAPPLMTYSLAAQELNSARKIIEVGAAYLAAQNATDFQIQKCGELIEEMSGALYMNNSQKYIEFDMEFHYQIIESANNKFVLHAYKGMQAFIEQFIQECLNLIPEMQKKSMNYHINIFEAIKSKSPDQASLQMENHIVDISKNHDRYSN